MSEIHQIPYYKEIPIAKSSQEVFKVAIKDLHPTQMCIGLAEVLQRRRDFTQQSTNERLKYLQNKPIPIVSDKNNQLWILDRHHRLRALLEIDQDAEAYGYIVAETDTKDTLKTLNFLSKKGWLYLFDSRGRGPHSHDSLPRTLLGMEDDSYRSLVWKLKKEGLISPLPSIPYYEFRWGNWLRTRPLPPFNSRNLQPALPTARKIVCSNIASHIEGWKNIKV